MFQVAGGLGTDFSDGATGRLARHQRRPACPASWIQTAESVTAGHADKICDLIADDILDAILRQDRFARVACEVMATTGMVIVTGQITTKCYLDITGDRCARPSAASATTTPPPASTTAAARCWSCSRNSPATSRWASTARAPATRACAWATPPTRARSLPVDIHYMPVPTLLANRLARRLADVRESGKLPYLYPDGKVQVSVRYQDDRPAAI